MDAPQAWGDLFRLPESGDAATAVAFDGAEEALWVGSQGGRLTLINLATLEPMASTPAHEGHAVTAALATAPGLYSASAGHGVLLHARSGMLLARFNAPGAVGLAEAWGGAMLAVGCAEDVRLFDVAQGRRGAVATVPLAAPATCVGAGRAFAVGTDSGEVVLVDPRARGQQGAYKAHNAGVTALAVAGDCVVTTGIVSKQQNRYNPAAGPSVRGEQLLKVFDLRARRQVAPLQFMAGGSPSLLALLQQYPRVVLALGAGGQMQLSDTGSDMPGGIFAVGAGGQSQLLSAATSSTGALLALGDAFGGVCVCAESPAAPGPANAAPVLPKPLPPFGTGAVPEMSVPALHPSPASLYMLSANPPREQLLSSFPPWLEQQKLRSHPQRAIADALVAQMSHHDFLGVVPNAQWALAPNSLCFGTGQAVAYRDCDPRDEGRDEADDWDASDAAAGGGGADEIPPRYRYARMHLTKRGAADFDFGNYNGTDFVGLENVLPHSFVNAPLQVLYHEPEVRAAAKRHLCASDACLACELGFLVDMLDKAQAMERGKRVCHAGNFVRAFQQLPEAAALGLLEDEGDLPQRLVTFFRFLLNALCASDKAALATAVGSAFAWEARHVNRCSQGHEAVRDVQALMLELTYPAPSSGGAGRAAAAAAAAVKEGVTFADVLLASLRRQARTRAWCDDCHDYRPITQTHGARSLPDTLCVAARCSGLVADALWRQNDPWLPARIAAAIGGDGEPWVSQDVASVEDAGTVYDLSAVVSCVEGARLVTHVLLDETADANGGDPRWLLLNDFRVEETVSEDARAFHPEWKEPCLLLFRRRAPRPAAAMEQPLAAAPVSPTVFDVPSLARGGVPRHPPLPAAGSLVAIDAEFVAVDVELARTRADGMRVLEQERRLALARVSVLLESGEVLLDDYVLPSEPVIDYLTRYSGLVAADLDPTTSRHCLLPLKAVFLKLKFLLDRGCIFCGHGLSKDFRICNLVVPPDQVVDTVDLFHQENQRKISLRWLAAALLGNNIQGETHDSIEDARTALELYRVYQRVPSPERLVTEIYAAGRAAGWATLSSPLL